MGMSLCIRQADAQHEHEEGELMSKSLKEARKKAWQRVGLATAAATGIGWLPGSSLFLGGVDAVLIHKVAGDFGVTDYTIEQVIGLIAKRFAGKSVAEILSVFVGPGWVIKAGVAGVLTFSAGGLLITYMEEKSPYS